MNWFAIKKNTSSTSDAHVHTSENHSIHSEREKDGKTKFFLKNMLQKIKVFFFLFCLVCINIKYLCTSNLFQHKKNIEKKIWHEHIEEAQHCKIYTDKTIIASHSLL